MAFFWSVGEVWIVFFTSYSFFFSGVRNSLSVSWIRVAVGALSFLRGRSYDQKKKERVNQPI